MMPVLIGNGQIGVGNLAGEQGQRPFAPIYVGGAERAEQPEIGAACDAAAQGFGAPAPTGKDDIHARVAVSADLFIKAGDLFGRVLEIAVENGDPCPTADRQAGTDGGMLAEITAEP